MSISFCCHQHYCLRSFFFELTVVDAVRHAATSLTIDIAHILLQARVCDTACAVGDGAVGICALRHSGCESRESEDNGGGSELHFENFEEVCL